MRQQKENKMPGFHIYKSKPSKAFPKPQFYSVFRATNGQVLSTSEMYTSKQGCIKGIKSILKLVAATDLCLYYDHTGKAVDLFVFEEF